ncbi:MAG: hypothetical protein AB1757_24390 [Acidobacteriota bacterium]
MNPINPNSVSVGIFRLALLLLALPIFAVGASAQTPDLSGTWVMYNDKAVQFDKSAVIKQNGANLSLDNGYGTKSTAVLTGRTFTTSDGMSGTVTPDGTRIDWTKPARYFWVRQTVFGATPDLNYKWMMFDDKSLPIAGLASIAQDGFNLSIDNGHGVKSTAVYVGDRFKTSDGLTGTPTADGSRINWSNGYFWIRVATNKPEVILDLSGTWIPVDQAGRPGDSRYTITQNGNNLTITIRDQIPSHRYSGTIKGTRFVGLSLAGEVIENATKIQFDNGSWVRESAVKAARTFPDTYGSGPLTLKPKTFFANFNANEMRCVNLTQNHVVIGYDANSNPQTQWADADLSTLCQGTKVPLRTVECYIDATNSVGTGDKPVVSHSEALSRCNAASFTPPAVRLGEDADVVSITPKGQTFSEGETLLRDSPPLDENGYHDVLKWIADKVAADRLPFCWVQAKARGGPVPFESTNTCPIGYVREEAQCRPKCPPDFNGRADRFTCYQTCPSSRPVQCSLFACAKDNDTCLSTVKDQLTAPVSFVTSVFGTLSKLGSVAAKAEKVSKLEKVIDTVKTYVENYQKAQTAITTIRAQMELYEKLAASNFDLITSPEIEAEVDKRFGRIAGYYIKRRYAQVHLALLSTTNFQATFKNIATLVGLIDPIGIVDLENAYYHPVCPSDVPFPKVTLHYNY